MNLTRATFAVCLLPCALVVAQQTPTFRSNVNMLAVDVMVVDKTGEPILGLKPGDFEVEINHQRRRVVSADLVQHAIETRPESTRLKPGSAPPPLAFMRTPGQISLDSRVFVIAIDDSSFETGALRGAMLGTQRFIDQLRTNDLVGVYVYPMGRQQLALTHDHRAVRDAIGQLIGRRVDAPGQFFMTPSEIVAIGGGIRADPDILEKVAARECSRPSTCRASIQREALTKAAYHEMDGAFRIRGLSTLIQDLARVPGRKHLMIVSGGLVSAPYGRPDLRAHMKDLSIDAARANISTYTIHIDEAFNEAMSATKRTAGRSTSIMADGATLADGLEKISGEIGGTFLSVKAGTGDFVFERILRETMAYYLLGVEPAPEDKNQRLMVGVKTTAKDATVRALREVIAK